MRLIERDYFLGGSDKSKENIKFGLQQKKPKNESGSLQLSGGPSTQLDRAYGAPLLVTNSHPISDTRQSNNDDAQEGKISKKSKQDSSLKDTLSTNTVAQIEADTMLNNNNSVHEVCSSYGEFGAELYSAVIKMHPKLARSPISENSLRAFADICTKANSKAPHFLSTVSHMCKGTGIPEAKKLHDYLVAWSGSEVTGRNEPSIDIPMQIEPNYELAYYLFSMQGSGAGLPALEKLKKFVAHWTDPKTGKTNFGDVKNSAWIFKSKGIPNAEQLRDEGLLRVRTFQPLIDETPLFDRKRR